MTALHQRRVSTAIDLRAAGGAQPNPGVGPRAPTNGPATCGRVRPPFGPLAVQVQEIASAPAAPGCGTDRLTIFQCQPGLSAVDMGRHASLSGRRSTAG